MKQFFGAFFGSILGLLISTVIIVIAFAAILGSILDDGKKPEQGLQTEKSIIHLNLSGELADRDSENPFEEIEGLNALGNSGSLGLNVLVKKIKQAKSDPVVKGLFLEMNGTAGAFANYTELRAALKDFKSSGKFIYAYAEDYSQKDYFLASVANKIFLNPEGGIDFKGLSMSIMFYKNMLEKLGVDVQIFRHGKFKSAIEPFMLDKMSEANRLQSEVFLNSIWSSLVNDISESRKIPVDSLNSFANTLRIESPQAGVDAGLVDELLYFDEVLDKIKQKAGLDKKSKKGFLTLNKYKLKEPAIGEAGKNKIAVIYAIGSISGGEGDDQEIGSTRIAGAIRKARLDDHVKAIVLRVNSPGGSALASDIIWRETQLAKKSKPFVVSMSDYAASGGYYISCGAHRIFAQANTITGSIGVFGIIPSFQRAMKDKLGITLDTVNTNAYSSMGSAMVLRERERELVQKSIEKVYDTFITKVAEGRKITKQQVDSIGQGRVWTGKDAMAIGLVDEIGGLSEAVIYAAKKAGCKDYKVLELPKTKNYFDDLLGKATESGESKFVMQKLRSIYPFLKHADQVISGKSIQARMPFTLTFDN